MKDLKKYATLCGCFVQSAYLQWKSFNNQLGSNDSLFDCI